MNALREAAQLALEALEYGQHSLKQISEYQWESRGQLAMDALKAALAQPEPAQGPAAWGDWWRSHGQYNFRATAEMTFERAKELMKLAFEVGREAAPPQRPPLTDEEISDIYIDWDITPGRRIADLVRAIERKVRGEKE